MYKHIQTQHGSAKPRLTASPLFVALLQGNQMTLVFMEREYSSPEEPHLGIVHMVEVDSPSQTFLWLSKLQSAGDLCKEVDLKQH